MQAMNEDGFFWHCFYAVLLRHQDSTSIYSSKLGFYVISIEGAWPNESGLTSCCVLGQDTLLSRCLSPPRSLTGLQQISGQSSYCAVKEW